MAASERALGGGRANGTLAGAGRNGRDPDGTRTGTRTGQRCRQSPLERPAGSWQWMGGKRTGQRAVRVAGEKSEALAAYSGGTSGGLGGRRCDAVRNVAVRWAAVNWQMLRGAWMAVSHAHAHPRGHARWHATRRMGRRARAPAQAQQQPWQRRPLLRHPTHDETAPTRPQPQPTSSRLTSRPGSRGLWLAAAAPETARTPGGTCNAEGEGPAARKPPGAAALACWRCR